MSASAQYAVSLAARLTVSQKGRMLLAAMILAAAQPEPEPLHDELIHADVPLWTEGSAGVWPRALIDTDEIGCANRIATGDWRFNPADEDSRSAHWYRIGNYGVFHCALLVGDADRQESLPHQHLRISFLVELGMIERSGGRLELWALQQGHRSGSNYLLLARPPGRRDAAFTVLQSQCPRGRMRQAASGSSFISRYCAINARREIVALARRMAELPPLGQLTYVAPIPDEE